MERRLAAIMAADVVGYSRLMGADEQGTLARLKALREDHFDPQVRKHGGRVVKLMGDGALVEFASVVAAVECAATVQRSLTSYNASSGEEEPIELRIGINLGDVIVDALGDLPVVPGLFIGQCEVLALHALVPLHCFEAIVEGLQGTEPISLLLAACWVGTVHGH